MTTTATPDPSPSPTPKLRRYRALQVLLAILTLAPTLTGFWYTWTTQGKALEQEFVQQSTNLLNALEQSFATHFEQVYSIGAFFDGSQFVDRREFAAFVDGILARKPNIQALDWIPKVPRRQRQEFEQAARADGWLDFRFKRWSPSGVWEDADEDWAEFYYPVFYMEPYTRNAPAAGIDLGSNPQRRRALEQARDTGKLVATAPLRLAQEQAKQAGVLAVFPIYEAGRQLGTVEARRAHLEGFALGAFRMGSIGAATLKELAHDNMLVSVVDNTDSAAQVLFREREGDPDAAPLEQLQNALDYEIGGRRWTFHIAALPSFVKERRGYEAWLALTGGLALSAAILAFMQALISRTHKVERLVAERTTELVQSSRKLQAATDRLKRTNEELERSNIELKQFAYVASHDLQTPLRTMGGFVTLLERKYKDQLDENANEYIQYITQGCENMQALLHNLLEYSRLDSQARPFEAVDLNQVVEDTLRQLNSTIVELNPVVNSDRLPVVKGDRVQLLQLFENLVANAFKYVKDDIPRVEITATRRDAFWELSIKDNGIGIDPRHHERIFGMFKRLHTHKEYPGTGIGLAICKRIVTRHGGSLWLESSVGKGSTFCFTLGVWGTG